MHKTFTIGWFLNVPLLSVKHQLTYSTFLCTKHCLSGPFHGFKFGTFIGRFENDGAASMAVEGLISCWQRRWGPAGEGWWW